MIESDAVTAPAGRGREPRDTSCGVQGEAAKGRVKGSIRRARRARQIHVPCNRFCACCRFVLLPPLLFEDAVAMDYYVFRKNLKSALLLAGCALAHGCLGARNHARRTVGCPPLSR